MGARARRGRAHGWRPTVGVRLVLRSALAEIAALFDTVYVSFYKGLGGVAGGMLLGEEDVIAEAREWRHRHGGTLFNLWPYAASALAGLRLRLPRMDCLHAACHAASPPHYGDRRRGGDSRSTADADDAHRAADDRGDLQRRGQKLATEQKLWAFGGSYPDRRSGVPHGSSSTPATPRSN